VLITFFGAVTSVAAHTFFFSVTELNFNPNTNKIEIIHEFTAHDIENTIAETNHISFSPEHPQYDQLIQAYFEQHFIIEQSQNAVQLNWIGFEVKLGKLIAYQESVKVNFQMNIMVSNSLLIDLYTKQINTVNYQYLSHINKVHGSLTFSQNNRIDQIILNKNSHTMK